MDFQTCYVSTVNEHTSSQKFDWMSSFDFPKTFGKSYSWILVNVIQFRPSQTKRRCFASLTYAIHLIILSKLLHGIWCSHHHFKLYSRLDFTVFGTCRYVIIIIVLIEYIFFGETNITTLFWVHSINKSKDIVATLKLWTHSVRCRSW